MAQNHGGKPFFCSLPNWSKSSKRRTHSPEVDDRLPHDDDEFLIGNRRGRHQKHCARRTASAANRRSTGRTFDDRLLHGRLAADARKSSTALNPSQGVPPKGPPRLPPATVRRDLFARGKSALLTSHRTPPAEPAAPVRQQHVHPPVKPPPPARRPFLRADTITLPPLSSTRATVLPPSSWSMQRRTSLLSTVPLLPRRPTMYARRCVSPSVLGEQPETLSTSPPPPPHMTLSVGDVSVGSGSPGERRRLSDMSVHSETPGGRGATRAMFKRRRGSQSSSALLPPTIINGTAYASSSTPPSVGVLGNRRVTFKEEYDRRRRSSLSSLVTSAMLHQADGVDDERRSASTDPQDIASMSSSTSEHVPSSKSLNEQIGVFLGRQHATEQSRNACLAHIYTSILNSMEMCERPRRLDDLLRHLCIHTYAEMDVENTSKAPRRPWNNDGQSRETAERLVKVLERIWDFYCQPPHVFTLLESKKLNDERQVNGVIFLLKLTCKLMTRKTRLVNAVNHDCADLLLDSGIPSKLLISLHRVELGHEELENLSSQTSRVTVAILCLMHAMSDHDAVQFVARIDRATTLKFGEFATSSNQPVALLTCMLLANMSTAVPQTDIFDDDDGGRPLRLPGRLLDHLTVLHADVQSRTMRLTDRGGWQTAADNMSFVLQALYNYCAWDVHKNELASCGFLAHMERVLETCTTHANVKETHLQPIMIDSILLLWQMTFCEKSRMLMSSSAALLIPLGRLQSHASPYISNDCQSISWLLMDDRPQLQSEWIQQHKMARSSPNLLESSQQKRFAPRKILRNLKTRITKRALNVKFELRAHGVDNDDLARSQSVSPSCVSKTITDVFVDDIDLCLVVVRENKMTRNLLERLKAMGENVNNVVSVSPYTSHSMVIHSTQVARAILFVVDQRTQRHPFVRMLVTHANRFERSIFVVSLEDDILFDPWWQSTVNLADGTRLYSHDNLEMLTDRLSREMSTLGSKTTEPIGTGTDGTSSSESSNSSSINGSYDSGHPPRTVGSLTLVPMASVDTTADGEGAGTVTVTMQYPLRHVPERARTSKTTQHSYRPNRTDSNYPHKRQEFSFPVTIETWLGLHVRKWLRDNQLDHLQKKFAGYDGPMLLELKHMYETCPNMFYQCVRADLTISDLKDVLRFAHCLAKLAV